MSEIATGTTTVVALTDGKLNSTLSGFEWNRFVGTFSASTGSRGDPVGCFIGSNAPSNFTTDPDTSFDLPIYAPAVDPGAIPRCAGRVGCSARRVRHAMSLRRPEP
jgi:hypothetical protein